MKLHNLILNGIVSYELIFKEKRQVAYDTFSFVFSKPVGFQYLAGEHARVVMLNKTDKEEKLCRFLSFASAPHEPEIVFVVRMSGSLFKRTLMALRVGEKLLMQVKKTVHRNSFAETYRHEYTGSAVFLVGGIGVAPAMSMIKDAVERREKKSIYLFYSCRRPEDAAYLDELQKISMQHPALTVIPTMTRIHDSSSPWHGETGHISAKMLLKNIPDLNSAMFYIAGKSTMTTAMFDLIRGLGVNKSHVVIEEFDSQTLGKRMRHGRHRWISRHKRSFGLGLCLVLVVISHIALSGYLQHDFLLISSAKPEKPYAFIGFVVVVILAIKAVFMLYRRKG